MKIDPTGGGFAMRKNKKYSNDFKLKVVQEYLQGKGSYKSLTKKYNISDIKVIRTWVNQYKEFGKAGLFRARKNEKYSLELKLIAIELYETTEMSYR